jgi:hypothetical protein
VQTNKKQEREWVPSRSKRQKLCKDHDILFTREVKSIDNLDAAIQQIGRELATRIYQIRATRKCLEPLLQGMGLVPPDRDPMQKRTASANAEVQPARKKAEASARTLDNYFEQRATSDPPPDIEALDIPDGATDVRSTYFRLHAKRDTYAEDKDFHIVKNALSELRGHVTQKRLHKMTTDPPKTPKTIRQRFKQKGFGTVSFSRSPSSADAGDAQQSGDGRVILDHSETWRTYYVKLLVLAQARRWLSTTERLDAIEDAPLTPKTNFQLADAIKHSMTAEYAPFGRDFEDPDAYSPIISRLLLYAEIHNCKDHDYGTFSMPRQELPYTYRQLQEWILERRRLQQLSNAAEGSSRQLIQTAEDLAAKLCAFASDGIVLKHLIEFALPSKKRADAAEVTPKATSATVDATDHTKDNRRLFLFLPG